MTILFGDHLNLWQSEVSNDCTCTKYDAIKEEFTDEPADDCYGDCWEFVVDSFSENTKTLRESNETGWWHVKDLNLWNRTVSGYFHAEKVVDILRGMTVDASWTLRYNVQADHVSYSLSHHDSMGGASQLWPVGEAEVERLGL